MISKLQYISSTYQNQSHAQVIEAICIAGGKWIQLRVKDQPEEEVLNIARKVRQICDQYEAVFILNDYPEIAKEVKADGVHLGKSDVPPKEARNLLGADFVIGGTANTMEDVWEYAEEDIVNYIGLGPFRFTKTKQHLSPILGLEGYEKVIQQCKTEGIDLPIVAIGGIILEDIDSIMATGIHGIAVSGLLTKASDKKNLIQNIKERLLLNLDE